MPRLAIQVRGVVQGVGFRPWVCTRAAALGLAGWVRNRRGGVEIVVQGGGQALDAFVRDLERAPEAPASVERLEVSEEPEQPAAGFDIRPSADGIAAPPCISPDAAVCASCLRESECPDDPRHLYPFTSCTRCGPRYSIVEALPFDRANTSMRAFSPCAGCAREYGDTSDRRMHAQTIACPLCGPRVRLVEPSGAERASGDDAICAAADAIRRGEVVAVQGVGGFHLVVDARSSRAVVRLRRRKRRDDKPFAVMFASVDAVREVCDVSHAEAEALAAPVRPIVLLRKLASAPPAAALAPEIAPRSTRLGALLPYTIVHHRLLTLCDRPLVCTSGNLSDEPLATSVGEALERLGGVADALLVHDLPIVRPVDDSVGRVGERGFEVLRRARGLVPLPLRMAFDAPPILALGGHLKCTVALLLDRNIVLSQHLGDMHGPLSRSLLERTARELPRLHGVAPQRIVCDLHPEYASSRLAERLAREWDAELVRVQHHHAHIAACVAEHGVDEPVLGLAWDGAGWGSDGTIWGGEALIVDGASCRRVAHLLPFRLPGGERAMREPRRSALGVLFAAGCPDAAHLAAWFSPSEASILSSAIALGRHAPATTSIGRLFDAIAALAGGRGVASFEGQAAMELEHAAESEPGAEPYAMPLVEGQPMIADFAPLVHEVLADRRAGAPFGRIASRFHAALADLAARIAERFALPHVALSGGCFQNALLVRDIRRALEARGFTVLAPRRYPPNDGGLSLGQVFVAAKRHAEGRCASESPVA